MNLWRRFSDRHSLSAGAPELGGTSLDLSPSRRGSSSAVCIHEATHAAAALYVGLAVEEVLVTGLLVAPAYVEVLYGVPAGTILPGQGCLIQPDCLELDAEGLLVAMVAPSCVRTANAGMDGYAQDEALLALDVARERGLDPGRIVRRAHRAVIRSEARIIEIAGQLHAHGALYGGADGLAPRSAHDEPPGQAHPRQNWRGHVARALHATNCAQGAGIGQ